MPVWLPKEPLAQGEQESRPDKKGEFKSECDYTERDGVSWVRRDAITQNEAECVPGDTPNAPIGQTLQFFAARPPWYVPTAQSRHTCRPGLRDRKSAQRPAQT